ncbi:MAG TPA: YcxB family protein [Terriglobales bacterium]
MTSFLLLAGAVLVLLLIRPTVQMAQNVAPLFVLVLLYFVLLGLSRRAIARQFAQQPGAHGPRMLLLDAAGAHWRWNGGSSDIGWKNYIRTVEGKNHFLFYISPVNFIILPKRAFDEQQINELQSLLSQQIHSR